MEVMVFDTKQPDVSVVILPDGKRDITILTDEKEITITGTDGSQYYTAYEYYGNQFRTVYELNESDIREDLKKYLNYDSSEEPTQEQILHDNEVIDSYTMQLMEEGLL